MKTYLEFDHPEGWDPFEIIAEIARQADPDEKYGEIRFGSQTLKWELVQESEKAEIDKRQRLAAAFLLTAIELPQDLRKVANSMLEAARINPGMTVDQAMIDGRRLEGLKKAKALIEDMIREDESKA